MKKIFLLFFVTFIMWHNAFTQVAVVENVRMNVLYQYVENIVAIAVPGIKSDNVFITANNSEIRKMDDVTYKIVVTDNIVTLDLNVYVVNQNDTVLYDKKQFRVLPINQYVQIVAFGGVNNEIIPKSLLKINNSISARFKDEFFYPNSFKLTIQRFSIIYGQGNKAYTHTFSGNKIPDDILNQILNYNSENEDITFAIFDVFVEKIGEIEGQLVFKLK